MVFTDRACRNAMSNATWLLTVAGVVTLILALIVTALSRHKKSASRQINVIGALGVIDTTLDPEGAVIVNGELWRARLKDGTTMNARTRVRVVGVQAHLLLVEPESDKL